MVIESQIKNSYIKQVESSKKYLIKECKKRDLGFIDTKTNFFYIKVPNKQIKKMYKFMFANKVLIKTSFWEDFRKLNNLIRITVGDISMMKKFFILFDKVYKKSQIIMICALMIGRAGSRGLPLKNITNVKMFQKNKK